MELNFTEVEEASSALSSPINMATPHAEPTYDSGMLDSVSTVQDLPTLDALALNSVPSSTGGSVISNGSSQGGKVANGRPARIAGGNLRPSDMLALDSSLGTSQRPTSGKGRMKPSTGKGILDKGTIQGI